MELTFEECSHSADSRMLQYTATYCNTHYNTLSNKYGADFWEMFTHSAGSRTAKHCNTLQHTATHCTQHTASHCNALQHTATHCNTPATQSTVSNKYVADFWKMLKQCRLVYARTRGVLPHLPWQQVALCCRVLQGVVVWYSSHTLAVFCRIFCDCKLHCVAGCCRMWQCVSVWYSPHALAVFCRIFHDCKLQGVAGCCRVLQRVLVSP